MNIWLAIYDALRWLGSHWDRIAITLILLAPPTIPTVHFLASGWNRKRREIMSYFRDDETIASYFAQFPPGIPKQTDNLKDMFEQVYRARLGLKLYIYPLFLILFTAAPLGWLGSTSITAALDNQWSFKFGGPGLGPTALAAIVGAYLWPDL